MTFAALTDPLMSARTWTLRNVRRPCGDDERIVGQLDLLDVSSIVTAFGERVSLLAKWSSSGTTLTQP